MEITCHKCGARAAEGQAFCSKCGAVIGMADASGGDDASWNMAATMVGQKLPPPPPRRDAAPPAPVERPGFQQTPAPRPGAHVPQQGYQQGYYAPAPQSPTSGGSNKTLFILLGLFALVVVGAVMLVILFLLLGS